MTKRLKKIKERGDTIIEVLIAISVISLVLAGAYVTTNRSLLATRAAEERGNALKMSESQLEQLKGLAKTNPDLIFGAGTPMPFCVSNVSRIPVIVTNPDCHVDAAGAPTNIQPVYNLSITRSASGNTFTITTQWSNVGGKVTDKLQLIYRVYR